MLFRKAISLAALWMTASVLVTACAGSRVVETSVKSNDPVTLSVFSMDGIPEDSFNQQYGDLIRKKFPNYTIKYIQASKTYGVKELIAAGEPIDLFFAPVGLVINGLMDYNLQFDMTDLIKKHGVDLGLLEKTSVDAMRDISGGKMYGVPVSNTSMVLFYNKDIFDKFGVPYPKDGMTWDEATELAKQVTKHDGVKQYVGLSTSPTHLLRMNQLSLPYVDPKTEKVTINSSPEWKSLYETLFVAPAQVSGYKEYMRAHKDGMPYREEFYKDKELAMFAWLTQYLFYFPNEFQAMNWDMVSLPTFKEKSGIGAQAYPAYFSVTSTSKHKDEAMEVIKYLITEEVQAHLSKTGTMPILNNDAVKKVFGQESIFKGKNFNAAFYNKFAPISPKTGYDNVAESPYVRAASDIILGKMDINSSFRSVEEQSNKKIQDSKAAK